MDLQKWIDENRPVGDPDYERVVEATALVEAAANPLEEAARRVSMEALTGYAMRRAEQVSAFVPVEAPDEKTLLTAISNAFLEGFAHGVLFMQHRASLRDPCWTA